MFLPASITDRNILNPKNPGTAPIVSYVDSLLDETESATILVGGLPVIREWPYEYKIAWSPKDVIEEYIRPARLIEGGKIVEKPALSDLELVNLPKIGTLEAFNTDGLRSLLYTIKIPSMASSGATIPFLFISPFPTITVAIASGKAVTLPIAEIPFSISASSHI